MTTQTWIGGGNNRADNPSDWSPAGVPQVGDIVIIDHGVVNDRGATLSLGRVAPDDATHQVRRASAQTAGGSVQSP